MPRAVVFQHVPGEGPGRLGDVLVQRNYRVEVRHLYSGDAVTADDADLLVVMGGPMGVGDVGEVRYPFLAREVELLTARVQRDAPTLGICLGAQLLAHAAGALVQPNRDHMGQQILEVGWEPVFFDHTNPNLQSVLSGLAPHETMLHWHGDTFALPIGAVRLGSTPRCANQGFLLKKRLCGLQFHPEVTADLIADWVHSDAAYVLQAGGPGHAERILADTRLLMPHLFIHGTRLLNNLLDHLSA